MKLRNFLKRNKSDYEQYADCPFNVYLMPLMELIFFNLDSSQTNILQKKY